MEQNKPDVCSRCCRDALLPRLPADQPGPHPDCLPCSRFETQPYPQQIRVHIANGGINHRASPGHPSQTKTQVLCPGQIAKQPLCMNHVPLPGPCGEPAQETRVQGMSVVDYFARMTIREVACDRFVAGMGNLENSRLAWPFGLGMHLTLSCRKSLSPPRFYLSACTMATQSTPSPAAAIAIPNHLLRVHRMQKPASTSNITSETRWTARSRVLAIPRGPPITEERRSLLS